jgi:asparagine synthase (glutamine-hydrolysing)
MCGIAGLMRSELAEPGERQRIADAEAVRRMLDRQVHRGPDGQGLFQDGPVVLGHRRLSIIDLSEAGKQPMSNEDGTLHVTYNGEIYNHRELRGELIRGGHQFRSQTDTEVLLHGYEQWGMEGLLDRLRGMFAFALHDTRRGLLLARDRLGIKPLYYHAGHHLLLFASEVKALLHSGMVDGERDRSALAGYLMAGAVPSPRTTYRAVRCLPAGSWAEWKDGRLDVRTYWDLERPAGANDCDAEELRALLEEMVERHLISDVPLGVFLSGGVDSAALVALATRVRRAKGEAEALTTLTVIFDEREFSEANAASEIARRFGTRHREIRVGSDDFKSELPAFLAAMDQPTNDGVNSYFVSKAARQAGLKVVLSGLGGDEVFWGYKHYRWAGFSEWVDRCPGPMRRLAANAGYRLGDWRGKDSWMRMAWLRSSGTSDRLYLTMRGFFAPNQVARLMDMTGAEIESAAEEHFAALGAGSGATGTNYIEMKRYLHDQLLRDTDVFSMAHSIEARVPFLDHVLVEKLWNTAPGLKLSRKMNKPLLVGAVQDDAVLAAGTRPKRGFTFPMARWMRSSAPQMQEMAETGSLMRGAVRECWGEFALGRMHWSRAWALTVLGATAG